MYNDRNSTDGASGDSKDNSKFIEVVDDNKKEDRRNYAQGHEALKFLRHLLKK